MANEKNKEINVKKVLDTASVCFIECGIEATTFAMIASKSGVSLRSVQRYYGVKAKLVEATLQYFINITFNEIKNNYSDRYDAHENGYVRLFSFLEMKRDFMFDHPEKMILINEMEIYCYKNTEAIELIQMHERYLEKICQFIIKTIQGGIKDGSIEPTIDAYLTGNMIHTNYFGMLERTALLLPARDKQTELFYTNLLNEYITMLRKYLKHD